MDRLVTLKRTLYAGAAVMVIVAAGAQGLWPSTDRAATVDSSVIQPVVATPHVASPTPVDVAAMDASTLSAIASANVFSPNRAAPKKRYVATSFSPETLPRIPQVAAPPALRLFGITITPDGAQALIEADPNIPGAEMYRVGDLVRRSRLLALSDSTAVLDGPEGRLTLRLRPYERTSQVPRPQ